MQTEITNILLDKGIITADQLHIAALEQRKQKRLLSEILIDLHFVSEQVIGALRRITAHYLAIIQGIHISIFKKN